MLNVIAGNSNFHEIIHRWLFFDVFKGQITEDIFSLLEENNIIVVGVPAKCTDRLQPMDLAVNKSAKDFMCENSESGIVAMLSSRWQKVT